MVAADEVFRRLPQGVTQHGIPAFAGTTARGSLSGLGERQREVESGAALLRVAIARMVYDESSHRSCRITDESRAVGKRARIALAHAEEGFVQQRRRADRHAGVRAKLRMRETMELGVERREEILRGGCRVARGRCRRRSRIHEPERPPGGRIDAARALTMRGSVSYNNA